MLNNDDKDVRELARSSLFLDLRRRKVPLGRESEPQFLVFKRKPSRKLDTHSAGFGVWSDWPDLNDLWVRTGVSLEWVRSESESARVSEDIITDPLTYVRAIATYSGDSHPLTSAGVRRNSLRSTSIPTQTTLDWTETSGKTCMSFLCWSFCFTFISEEYCTQWGHCYFHSKGQTTSSPY